MPTRSGINFRTKFTIPSTDLNSSIVSGVGKLTIAFMRSSPIRIPSAVSTCPKYLTSRGPNCTFDGFRVRPAACSALNMFSSSCRWPYQVDEQHIQSSIYTKRPLFGPKCAKACDVFREKRNGALAIPNGSRSFTDFLFCMTKAVLSCSLAATGV